MGQHPDWKALALQLWAGLYEVGQLMAARWARWRQARPRLALALVWAGRALVAGLVLLFLFYQMVRWGAFGALPDREALRRINNNVASEIYSADGELLGKFYIQNRTNVGYDDIAPHVVDALVATEDVRFFKHHGIDRRSALRVLFKSLLLFDESAGGGSTISQQLAKNLFPRRDYGLFSMPVNKVREMIVAQRLEKVYSKEKILTLYLNTVPFSDNVYGIEVAAKRFFGASPGNISVEDAAVLIGTLKATNYFNPRTYPERARERRNVVLAQMARYGYLDGQACDSLQALPLRLDYYPESHSEGRATYFRERLRQDLLAWAKEGPRHPDGRPYNIYTDGLKIYTTIDATMQRHAEAALKSHMADLQKRFDQHWRKGKPWGDDKVIERALERSLRYQAYTEQGLDADSIAKLMAQPMPMRVYDGQGAAVDTLLSPLDSVRHYHKILNAGFFAMSPQTGDVKAWVGGVDHRFFQYDHVRSRRQVGSTFKPIVYLAAMQHGIAPCDYTANELRAYPDYQDWQPENSDGDYGGYYSMQGALAKSLNVVAVQFIMQTGTEPVRRLARRLGIGSPIPEGPAIALGAAEASLYDMVQVYACFANQGRHVAPRYLLRIESEMGELLDDFSESYPPPTQAIEPEEAQIMTHLLRGVVDSGTAQRLRYAYGIVGDVAGKTGTTNQQSDGWFIGFTPDLAAGAWVGADDPAVRFRALSLGQGASTALPIWGLFMQKMQKEKDYMKRRRAYFPPLPDSLALHLDCPPFLAEYFPEEGFEEDEAEGFFERIVEQEARSPEEQAAQAAEREARRQRRREEWDRQKAKTRRFFERVFGEDAPD